MDLCCIQSHQICKNSGPMESCYWSLTVSTSGSSKITSVELVIPVLIFGAVVDNHVSIFTSDIFVAIGSRLIVTIWQITARTDSVTSRWDGYNCDSLKHAYAQANMSIPIY